MLQFVESRPGIMQGHRQAARPRAAEEASEALNKLQHAPETELLIAVRDRRDKQAFAQLFDIYAPKLKAMVMRSGTPAAQAEDIVQDAMLSVWRKAAQFDAHRSQASGWIYRIARNRMIDIARRDYRPLPEELKIDEPPAEQPAEIMAMDQEAARLRAALDTLPQSQREMIEKAYLGELSHKEITETTGLPLGTIKSRIRLGLERLRHELKDLRQS
ncbi:RNA polymerase sigma-70 factor, ECF subfamily [Salinihabitans flavidus]|uniref:RNA polymerase sigma-70 factor, ECF subfamily n=1 Tax=Salinihabitans flavidus TaxID=569882 RepID=A0A1H8MNX8_9RHOB|nr:sigma-70 family RNA polymerase sigma factor [Salinihabitans flavidus]SEO19151.1 RNA polymerase sigma-70 factor, ECF subfamily [Salinihabitans flavidus]